MPIRKIIRRFVKKRNSSKPSEAPKFNFASFHDEVDAQFQFIGAAVIGSWEVLLTDVSRSYRQKGKEIPVQFRDRLSDAIVPVQQCFQTRSKAIQSLTKQLAQQNQVEIFHVWSGFDPLPTDLFEAWSNTSEYMKDSFEAHDLESVYKVWNQSSSLFAEGVQKEHQFLKSSLSGSDARVVLPALVRWRENVSMHLETELYNRRTELIRGIEGTVE
jgi:hypothetical protein